MSAPESTLDAALRGVIEQALTAAGMSHMQARMVSERATREGCEWPSVLRVRRAALALVATDSGN